MDVVDTLRLDVPVAQAGMPGVAGHRLAAAVPATLLEGMPGQWADRAALYAGESVLRIDGVVPAKQAIVELAG